MNMNKKTIITNLLALVAMAGQVSFCRKDTPPLKRAYVMGQEGRSTLETRKSRLQKCVSTLETGSRHMTGATLYP